jgi:transcriptional regulator with XRE-family HTH domain
MANLLATFSQNLKMLRLEKGFTQEALADACEFHRTYIGAMERGERNISLRNLEKLADVLEVSAARLITRYNDK